MSWYQIGYYRNQISWLSCFALLKNSFGGFALIICKRFYCEFYNYDWVTADFSENICEC